MSCRRTMWSLVVVAALAAGPAALALDVGEAAPELAVKTWVSNSPVALAEAKGKVVVVEFWGTWCGPCRITIPRLNKLQARFRDEKVVLVGLTKEDETTVREFLKTVPMRYHVGLVDEKAYDSYMAGIDTIPHAFVVDGAGKVVWKDNPLKGVDRAVSRALDPEREKKLAGFREQLKQAKSFEQAFAAVDAAIKAVPDDPEAFRVKRMLLLRQGRRDDAQKMLLAMAEACAQSADVLAEVSGALATTGALHERDLVQALELAKKAVAISKSEDPDHLGALARAHYELGHLALAVEAADQAAQLDPNWKAIAAYFHKELERRRQDPDAKL